MAAKMVDMFENILNLSRVLRTLSTRALVCPRYSGTSAPSVLALRVSILYTGKKIVSIVSIPVKKIVTPRRRDVDRRDVELPTTYHDME